MYLRIGMTVAEQIFVNWAERDMRWWVYDGGLGSESEIGEARKKKEMEERERERENEEQARKKTMTN